MIDDSEIIWEGKPKYVFKLYFLEQEAYYDVATGFSNSFIIYIFFMSIIIYVFEQISTIDLNYYIYGLLLMIGMVIPDIFNWVRLKRKLYILTKKYIKVYANKNILENKIPLTEILNSYSLDESKNIETIVITYKSNNSEKIMNQKIENILKIDNFQGILSKLQNNRESH